MSSTKRSYNETVSSISSISTILNEENEYVVLEGQQVKQDMDIEEQIRQQDMDIEQQVEEENFVRKKRLNIDKDDLFKSNTNDHSFQSSTPISSTLNYPSTSNTSSNTPNSITSSPGENFSFTTSSFLNNYISPRDSFNNNNTHDGNSTLKVSEDAKALSPVELLMSSPPISTSTPKTSQTKNTSNSSLTLTTQNSDTWDSNYTDSFPASNSCNHSSSNNYEINNYFTRDANLIHTGLNKNSSRGPFSPIYSQIYDNEGIAFATESFNYLVQLYEFCDSNSTKLQSNITSTLRDLVLLINNQLDGFDIPFIEHHKWNGSHFYGSIDVESLLDQLDDGLGISSAKYVWYDCNNIMRTSGSVLQCGYRRTRRRTSLRSRIGENQSSSYSPASSPPASNFNWSADNTNDFQSSSSSSATSDLNDTNDLQDNDLSRSANKTNLQDNNLRHAVLNRDAEREAQIFLELLAEEEENEDNGIEQEESDSFAEISNESEEDDDSLIQGFASTSIRQHTDTFGNPINQTRTISTRHISRPADNDGNETDNDLVESGNLTESTYEEIDFSDIESIATDSTTEDGWHNVSRDN